MLVYRVEHPETRIGPYNSKRYKIRGLNNAHAKDIYNHPAGMIDGLYALSDNRFAFTSQHQLLEWFDGYISKLIAKDFVCAIYKVYSDSIQIGKSGKQCMFNIMEAAYIKSIPLDSLNIEE